MIRTLPSKAPEKLANAIFIFIRYSFSPVFSRPRNPESLAPAPPGPASSHRLFPAEPPASGIPKSSSRPRVSGQRHHERPGRMNHRQMLPIFRRRMQIRVRVHSFRHQRRRVLNIRRAARRSCERLLHRRRPISMVRQTRHADARPSRFSRRSSSRAQRCRRPRIRSPSAPLFHSACPCLRLPPVRSPRAQSRPARARS